MKILIALLISFVLFGATDIIKEEANINLKKMEEILNRINSNKIKPVDNTIDNKLLMRMNINKQKGFNLAYKRDLIILKTREDKNKFERLLNNIISYRISMKKKKDFENLLNKFSLSDLKYKMIDSNSSTLERQYNEALSNYVKNKNNIKSTIIFLKSNLNKIIEDSNIMSFKKIITAIDSNIFVYKINLYIQHIVNITIGQIVISILIMGLIFLSRFFLLPIISSVFNKAFNNKESKEAIINSLKKPLNYFLLILSIDILVHIFKEEDSIYLSISYWAIFFWVLNNIIDNSIELYSEKLMSKYSDLRSEILLFFKKIMWIISILIFVSIILSKLGVEIVALLGGFGVIGLGVSLAFKDTFSNLIASVNVIFDKSFSVGDWIAVNDIEGTVIEIGMRQTRIRGFANNEYAVPNSLISTSVVTNWSKRKIGRRIKFKIGLTYNTPIDKVIKIKNEIKKMLELNDNISNRDFKFTNIKRKTALLRKEDDYGIKNNLLVFIDELNTYSIDILVYAFTKTVSWEDWLIEKENVLIEIMKIVENNNAEFAFPTQTLFIKK